MLDTVESVNEMVAWLTSQGGPPSEYSRLCRSVNLDEIESIWLALHMVSFVDSARGVILNGESLILTPQYSCLYLLHPNCRSWTLSYQSPLIQKGLLELASADRRSDSPTALTQWFVHYVLGGNFPSPILKVFTGNSTSLPDWISSHILNQKSTRYHVDSWPTQLGVSVRECYHLEPSFAFGRLEDLDQFIEQWNKETKVVNAILVVDASLLEKTWMTVLRLMHDIESALIVVGKAARELSGIDRHLEPPSENHEMLLLGSSSVLSDRISESQMHRLIGHFRTSATVLRAVVGDLGSKVTFETLWNRLRAHHRRDPGTLARLRQSNITLGDVILEHGSKAKMKKIISTFEGSATTKYVWKINKSDDIGWGLSVLFTGPPGTGKTMAAQAIANELNLDLLHVDLSRIISKYIGETEKNLAAIFDFAESTGSIPLFDEADALFGRRSDVKDSHDRYANQEISYLLQRIESFRGVAILTTNLSDAIDSAFKRRIRTIVHFPFPDPTVRHQIWSSHMSDKVPIDHSDPPDYRVLAELPLSGGSISNVVFTACAIAAGREQAVSMEALLDESEEELAKHGKSSAIVKRLRAHKN